jgi:ferritin-like metal-binding protein YciE
VRYRRRIPAPTRPLIFFQQENPMKLALLHDLYVEELRDLYNAEKQLLTALPKMTQAAYSADLRQEFEDHFDETERQVERLERIFADLGISPEGKRCSAMQGLIEEVVEKIEEDADPHVRDAALISAAQRIEHYEMAGYGCARTFARSLGYQDMSDLLQESLNEECATDQNLTDLAETTINAEAATAGGGV